MSEAQGPDAVAEQHYLMGVARGRGDGADARRRMDERARALAVFLELQGAAGMYRHVEQRVARLTTTLLGG